MNLILLSGNSILNKSWIEDVEKILRPLFSSTYIHYYKHWTNGSELIDLDYEIKTLSSKIKDMEPYIIFAKSAGSLVTLKGTRLGVLNPVKCVFVGTPVKWSREYKFEIDEWINGFSIPTLFMQKNQDPMYGFSELKKFLGVNNVQNYQMEEIEGNDHHYENLDQIRTLVENFKIV